MRSLSLGLALSACWACSGPRQSITPNTAPSAPTSAAASSAPRAGEAKPNAAAQKSHFPVLLGLLLQAKSSKGNAQKLLREADAEAKKQLRNADKLAPEAAAELAYLVRQTVGLTIKLHLDYLPDDQDAARDAVRLAITAKTYSAAIRSAREPLAYDELIDRLAARIPQNGVLLEFVGIDATHQFVDQAVKPMAGRWAVFGIQPDRSIFSFVLKVKETAIADSIGGLLGALSRQQDPSRFLSELQGVGNVPFKVASKAKHLIIAPDASLNLLPFELLRDDQGKSLIDRALITYVASGSDLLGSRAPASSSPRDAAPVIVSNPDFNLKQGLAGASPSAAPGDLWGSGELFSPNPFSGQEQAAVESALGKSTLLTGATATKASLLALHGPPVLHVATHGKFMNASAAKLSPGDEIDASDMSRYALLALSGANQPPVSAGRLSALEMAGIDLAGTHLAVLSACESGVAYQWPGEGSLGFRDALAAAGAEAQVVSLWPVRAETTATLMGAFYKRLALGPGDALRLAKLEVREQHPNPYFWAGFVLSGDWRPFSLPAPAASKAEPTSPRVALANPELGSLNASCVVTVLPEKAAPSLSVRVKTHASVTGCVPPPQAKVGIVLRELYGSSSSSSIKVPFSWSSEGIADIDHVVALPTPGSTGLVVDITLPCGPKTSVTGTGRCELR